ncbi:MAG: HAD-IIB family hydrolase [Clostridia bacterium]|nr:HAD-IIB family hydrolase [Clostridia bacterium]
MQKYKNHLIVSDLDGTFLGKGGRIVQRNVDAIKHFTAEGGMFTFATGRHHHHLLEAIPVLSEIINAPAIVANGAYLYDYRSHELIAESFMDTELTLRALQYARANYPQVGFRASTPQGILTDGRTDYMRRYVNYCHEKLPYVVEVAPPEKWIQRLWYKIVFRGKCEDLDALKAALQKEFGGQFEYNKSSDTFFEIQKGGINKGTMLHVLQKSYAAVGGQPVKTYGVGDFENDLTLLRAADVAVCPANAHPAVKNAAKMVLCDHDEGVIADLIERIG